MHLPGFHVASRSGFASGQQPRSVPAAWYPGSQSHSAPGSSFISRSTWSRSCGRRCSCRSRGLSRPFWHVIGPLLSPSPWAAPPWRLDLRPPPSKRPSSPTRCCPRRYGTSTSRVLWRSGKSASAPTASSCGLNALPVRASTRGLNACGYRCAKAPRRRSAVSSSSRRGFLRRPNPCAREAMTSRATCTSRGWAHQDLCSGASEPPSRRTRPA
jgi:hypothetical protein